MGREKLYNLTVAEAAPLLKNKEISPVELLESTLEHIAAVEGRIKAFVTLVPELARAAAKEAEQEILEGYYRGPLHGIPYAAKDIIYTKGIPTLGGSQAEEGFVPQTDAAVVEILREAGAVLVGKTTTTEYAFLGGTPLTCNAWNTAHTPGGSSAGSGAAVGARLVPFALGTQTIGSLLRPSAYNGLTCLKGTYGRISRRGVIPASWSLDHIGALTRSVEDTAIINEILMGEDKADSRSLQAPVPQLVAAQAKPADTMVLGYTDDFFRAEDEVVQENFRKALDLFRAKGLKVVKVSFPKDFFQTAAAAANIVMRAEAASYHRDRFARVPDKFGPYMRDEIRLGCLVSAVDYLDAQRVRRQVMETLQSYFTGIDVLLTPSTVTLPPKGLASSGSPLFNGLFTNTGLPSMTIPSGFDAETGLPTGLQLAADRLQEEKLMTLGALFQQSTDFHLKEPAL